MNRRRAAREGFNLALEMAIEIVRRRHGNDWSANDTLRELEVLRQNGPTVVETNHKEGG